MLDLFVHLSLLKFRIIYGVHSVTISKFGDFAERIDSIKLEIIDTPDNVCFISDLHTETENEV